MGMRIEHQLMARMPGECRVRAVSCHAEQTLCETDDLGYAAFAGPQEENVIVAGFELRSARDRLANSVGDAPGNGNINSRRAVPFERLGHLHLVMGVDEAAAES